MRVEGHLLENNCFSSHFSASPWNASLSGNACDYGPDVLAKNLSSRPYGSVTPVYKGQPLEFCW